MSYLNKYKINKQSAPENELRMGFRNERIGFYKRLDSLNKKLQKDYKEQEEEIYQEFKRIYSHFKMTLSPEKKGEIKEYVIRLSLSIYNNIPKRKVGRNLKIITIFSFYFICIFKGIVIRPIELYECLGMEKIERNKYLKIILRYNHDIQMLLRDEDFRMEFVLKLLSGFKDKFGLDKSFYDFCFDKLIQYWDILATRKNVYIAGILVVLYKRQYLESKHWYIKEKDICEYLGIESQGSFSCSLKLFSRQTKTQAPRRGTIRSFSKEQKNAIIKFADEQGIKTSELVRDAVIEYINTIESIKLDYSSFILTSKELIKSLKAFLYVLENNQITRLVGQLEVKRNERI